MRKLTIGAVTLVILGIISIIVGGLLIGLFDEIIKIFVKQQVPLKSNGFSEGLWAKPPYAVRMQYWVYDIQNPRQVMYDGAVPIYVEKGPYTYREVQVKHRIKFNDNDTVSYINRKNYTFLADESKPFKEDDLVTVPNVPFFTILNLLRLSDNKTLSDLYANNTRLVSAAMNYLLGEEPFTLQKVKVGELIYTGYDDPIFQIGTALGQLLNLTITGLLPKMALFYGQQTDQTDGVYEVNTGQKDFTKTGEIINWNFADSLNFWATPEANMINGTDGTLYHAFVKKTDTLRIFITNICRSLYATSYEKEPDVTIKGIPAYRFSIPEDVFSLSVPDNAGFGYNQTDEYFGDTCANNSGWSKNGPLLDGFLNVSYGPQTSCQRVAGYPQLPLVISSPHFLFCPQCVLDFFQFDNPNLTEQYTSFLDIEPTTGVGLRFSRRLQVNLAMWSDPKIPTMKNLRPGIYPVVWLNESALVDDATAKSLYNKVVVPKRALIGIAWLMIAIGILTFLGVLVGFLIYRYRCKCDQEFVYEDEQPILSDC